MAIYNVNGDIVNANSIVSDLRDKAYTVLISQVQGTQGSCTDGVYLYSANTSSGIYKFNIIERDTSSETVSVVLDHANDMTYNPLTGKLYVCTMDANAHIAIVDPITFESEMFELKNPDESVHLCYGIAYDRKNNQYIIADGGTSGTGYSFYDSEFNFVKTITITRNEAYTIQGIETDGEHIYRALSPSGSWQGNYIYIHDMDMNYVTRIEIPYSGELESISYDWNGSWYVTYNSRTALYVGLTNALSFETSKQFQKIVNAYSS